MNTDDPNEVPDASQGLLTQLLETWSHHRRLILVTITFITFSAFISSLSQQTQHALALSLWANQRLVALLLIFLLLTLSLLWSAGQRLDTWIFLLFNLHGHHPLWLDRVMWVLTQIGSGILGLLLAIVLYFSGLQRLAFDFVLGILSLWLVVEAIKAMVDRRRPFFVIESARVIGWRERGLSFPSGHTAQSFFMATLMAQYLHASPTIGLILYGTAISVAFTRIYVGAHYPRDVLGGAILGTVWGILSSLSQTYLTLGRF